MQLQGRLVAIVFHVLTAVERMRDQLLKHLGGELPVLDAIRKIAFDDGPNVHLGWQIVFDDRLSRVFD